MSAFRFGGLVCLAAVLAACENDQGQGKANDVAGNAGDTLPPSTAAAAAGDTAAATPGADLGAGGQGTVGAVTVQLAGLGGSTATGTANVVGGADGRTQISLTVNGAAPGERAAHVHEGNCEQLGPPVGALQTVSVTGTGSATVSQSTLDLPPATVMDGRHAISVHEPNGNPGKPEICGDIPALAQR